MASAGTGDLRAILNTTLVLVDYFGDTERNGAMLIELKRALERAIGVLNEGPAVDPSRFAVSKRDDHKHDQGKYSAANPAAHARA
jgi:hypothetical protein